MSNSTTDRVHGELLREWRESQKIDVSTLAGHANLSVAQIRQLESGGSSLFYTAAIKESAARKVASLLGMDPVAVIRHGADAVTHPEPSVVDELIELSRKKSPSGRSSAVFSFSPRWIALLGFSLVLLGSADWFQKNWQNRDAQNFWHQAVAMPTDPPATAMPSAASSSESGMESAALLSTAKSAAAVAEWVTPEPRVAPASEPPLVAVVQAKPTESVLCQPGPADPVLTPAQPSKAGDMVYLVAQKEGAVCVVDGAGLRTVLSLKANEAKSIYGPPPWRVHFEQAEQAQLYFQGVRVRPPDAKTTAVVLQEGTRSP